MLIFWQGWLFLALCGSVYQFCELLVILGHFGAILGDFGRFWALLGDFEPFWAILGDLGIFI
jgi:hypothetical protein